MIIEIKGLPDGQAIKHINVDITFDENGSVTKSTVNSSPAIEPHPITNTTREKKDVPAEMTDMEF